MVQINAHRLALFAVGAAFALASAAWADDYVFLTPAEVDVAIHALPAPPADGSPRNQSELAELKHFQATRTPDEVNLAVSDTKTKNATIFAAAIGPAFDLKALPATAKLFADIRNDEKLAADQAKGVFKRHRPWIVDPSLQSCSKADDPQSSYPSGHSSMGYVMAAVLVDLVPEKADAIEARADLYAHNRLVCEVHFHSDVDGGRAFGPLLAKAMARSPVFQAEYAAAAQELRAAHVTGR